MPPTASDTVRECLRAVHLVNRPDTWRAGPTVITYLYVAGELDASQLGELYAWALSRNYPNVRVITPRFLQWARLFHPRFHEAAARSGMPGPLLPPVRLRHAGPLTDAVALSRFRWESTAFLAAVTLSAAIIQSRWSEGTLASKYDRLWQLGLLAEDGTLAELASLDLKAAVRELASSADMPPTDRLLAIREQFEQVLARMAMARTYQSAVLRADPLPPRLRERFGFVDALRATLGEDLLCIVVYGSSVSGMDFADYDALVVSRDPRSALRRMAGTSPTWRGKELNLGVYSPAELWNMQALSGDNLADYGLCVYGEVAVPTKPKDILLARNFSFGAVRQGQQLGMIGSAMTFRPMPEGDDRRNLYDYFVKIPANIAKGTWGALDCHVAKADVYEWLQARCGFDTRGEQAVAAAGSPGVALAAAAVATGNAMSALNADLGVLEGTV
ncbi:MAG: hypothetical protein ACJ74U_17870 [Jatrophihabitantaceae bacterium]